VFYYALVGVKIVMLLLLVLVIYVLSFRVKTHINKLWWVATLLLVPLIIAKTTHNDHHFIQHVNRYLDNAQQITWFGWFQLLGLSYFSFNGISYLVDIKRKYIVPEKNFFLLLLYLLYFPTVFSGPLHRAKYMFTQFKQVTVTNTSISQGLRLILWGLFKNTVIAQRLYKLLMYSSTTEISGGYYLMIGLIFFLYLYCNFSAFVDFSQGISQLFNIRLQDNFNNRVYLASSRQTFWQGWHKTLNAWFRDYFFFVVIKYDKKRRYTNTLLLLTFLLIALWHGFNYSLLVWGTMNGLWIILEKKVSFKEWRYPKIRRALGTCYHLLVSSILALVFISPSISVLIERVFNTSNHVTMEALSVQRVNIAIIIIAFGIMDYHYSKAKTQRFDEYLQPKFLLVRWLIYFKLVLFILIFGEGISMDNYYNQF
jgi:alginate O-acetyltransferase complex protein AlgI